MSLGEFDLIAKYFNRPTARALVGLGDDCALLAAPTPGTHFAISSDMLIEGRHFISTIAADRLGHKALAVNLSDLAACGAKPIAFTLAISLPRVDEDFLAGFAHGLFALADAHAIELVGGDTTAGPLSVCITVIGEVAPAEMLRRDGARTGDDLWVTGTPGDARLALEVLRGSVALPGDAFERVRRAMELPQPQVALGLALKGLASSAIDVSDGLIGDLSHLRERSRVGATVDVDAIACSEVLASQPLALRRLCALAGGDDYELLFTAPVQRRDAVVAAARGVGVQASRIGRVDAEPGLRLIDAGGQRVIDSFSGFDHFRS